MKKGIVLLLVVVGPWPKAMRAQNDSQFDAKALASDIEQRFWHAQGGGPRSRGNTTGKKRPTWPDACWDKIGTK